MSESKHTPGPWDNKSKRPVVRQTKSGEWIADVGGMDWDEQGANARLIAASPDLLAALKFMVDAAKTEPGMSIYKAHIEQAEVAIAKAEGQDNE